ncbi:efflux pump fus6 [Colletotrichum spaethianum]|uniref:Efflux pump fus6 n=1 Tax=Colletotrichum spaethianum TaxID=700344 RepID=A0AA37PF89_9PEZI|nr:efflux pump fus6 [Colletotrichum spaethianum]GKT51087.1 efflux pump fus6 [Colletotrichum spaethianum]
MAGGAISGAATNASQLILGRTIQGAGVGGITVMSSIIVSDLVPLRDRGKYIAITLVVYLVWASSGPLIGGSLSQANSESWRWNFWLQIPFGVLSVLFIVMFLKVETKEEGATFWGKMRRIDYVGNFLVIGSTASILYALTYSGSNYPWNSPRIIASMVVDVLGLVIFVATEGFCDGTPVMPLRLLGHRTGAIVALNTFSSALLNNWVNFFLPVYFQAVKQSTPFHAGAQILPLIIMAVLASIVAFIVVSKFGKYKLLHILGFAGMALGLGLFARLDRRSSNLTWIMTEIAFSAGLDMVINTLLPAFQAGVPESDQAAATSTFSFFRGLANIWPMTIPATIFNNRCETLSQQIPDANIRSALSSGHAYGHATQAFLSTLSESERSATIEVFTQALKLVWYVAPAFAVLSMILAMVERNLP